VRYTLYDALGHAVQEGAPYQTACYVYQVDGNGRMVNAYRAPDLNQPRAITQYDALGRATRVTGPDGAANTVVYAGRSTIQVDANGHYKSNATDALGQLVRVDETLVTFEEPFAALNSAIWTFNGFPNNHRQSIDGGALKNVGTGSNYDANFYRAQTNLDGGQQGQGIQVEFKVDGGDTLAHFALETVGSPYCRLAAVAAGNKIYVQYSTGNGWVYPADLINPVEVGVWYVLTLKITPSGWSYIEVWRKDDPGKRGAYAVKLPSGLSYRFHHWVYRGTAWLDNYRELNYQSTRYAYDTLGNLTTVTDAAGNMTTMTYNVLGRKTAMTDPDMGQWYYFYDDGGNLIAQVDAKKQATNFYYDALSRLRGKTYATTTTPQSYVRPADPGYNGYTVKYYYSESGYGFSQGRRTRMVDASGSGASGSGAWIYDARGRVTREDKTIAGAGTFTTQYSYDAMDRVTAMTYPDGEVVATTYSIAAQPTRLRSQTLVYDYVKSVSYNPLGQTTRLQYGNGLETRYSYFGIDAYPRQQWGNQFYGRLFQACVTAQNDPNCPNNAASNAKLNLSYWYDNVGNVTAIRDRTNDNQVQWFTYDSLDRLVRGYTQAQGGGTDQGRYDETYAYNSIGNVMYNSDIGSYTYPVQGSPRPHAVTEAGGNTYTYNANGNMEGRIEETDRYLVDSFEYTDNPASHNWKIYAGSGTMATATDVSRSGRVLHTSSSQGTGFGVQYPASGSLELPRRMLSVWIKDSDQFSFYVRVRATNGSEYYIQYVPASGTPYPSGGYAIVPIGTQYRDGTWRKLRRDLDADLRAVFGVGVERVLFFCIRGTFDLDDLRLSNLADYAQTYDAENHLTQVKKNGVVVTTFTYDADGNRVKKVKGSVTTLDVGAHFEKTAGAVTKGSGSRCGSTPTATA
jgi:YD repeat-containing protein